MGQQGRFIFTERLKGRRDRESERKRERGMKRESWGRGERN